jgi:hypothetical protein
MHADIAHLHYSKKQEAPKGPKLRIDQKLGVNVMKDFQMIDFPI